jgi:hypothetical protein
VYHNGFVTAVAVGNSQLFYTCIKMLSGLVSVLLKKIKIKKNKNKMNK